MDKGEKIKLHLLQLHYESEIIINESLVFFFVDRVEVFPEF